MDVRPYGADTIIIPFTISGGGDELVVARMSRMRPRGELFRGGVVGGVGRERAVVPVQYAVPAPFPFPLGSVFIPGSRANEDFVHSTENAYRALRNAPGSILESRASEGSPPPGSKLINEWAWSGDHGVIKDDIGAAPADNVMIAPNEDVWLEHPDGSWTNYGSARSFTGSGKPSGQKGKDREPKWRTSS